MELQHSKKSKQPEKNTAKLKANGSIIGKSPLNVRGWQSCQKLQQPELHVMISSTLMTWNSKKTRTKTSVIRQRLWLWWETIWNHLWPSTHTPKFEVVQQRSHLICLSGTCLIKTQRDAQVSPKVEALSSRKTTVAQNGCKLRIFPCRRAVQGIQHNNRGGASPPPTHSQEIVNHNGKKQQLALEQMQKQLGSKMKMGGWGTERGHWDTR